MNRLLRIPILSSLSRITSRYSDNNIIIPTIRLYTSSSSTLSDERGDGNSNANDKTSRSRLLPEDFDQVIKSKGIMEEIEKKEEDGGEVRPREKRREKQQRE